MARLKNDNLKRDKAEIAIPNQKEVTLTKEKMIEYGEIFFYLLADFYEKSKEKTVYITKTDIVRLLGVVNENYYMYYNKAGELACKLSHEEEVKFNRDEIIKFYKKINKNIKKIADFITTYLFWILEEEDVLVTSTCWEAIAVEATDVEYKAELNKFFDEKDIYETQNYYRRIQLTDEQLLQYVNLVRDVRKEMGNGKLLTAQQITISNRWAEYNSKIKKRLISEMGIMRPYKVYGLTFSPEGIQQKIGELKKDLDFCLDLYEKYYSNNTNSLNYHTSVAKIWGKKELSKKLNRNSSKAQKEKNKIKFEAKEEQKKYLRFCYWVILTRMNKQELERYLNKLMHGKASQNEKTQANIKKYQEYAKRYFYNDYIDEDYDDSEMEKFIENT